MSRPIDADALYKDICRAYDECGDILEIIDKQPTIEPEQRWIPCSERLPENSDTVLITHRGGVSVGWYNGRYWERGANTKHRPLQTVIAWMPLPTPWEGGQDG